MQKPTASILTVITILSRLIPHPANFTTLGATSLFSGSKLGRPWNYIVPFVAMVVTDLIIGLHGTMVYVYLSIAISIWIGEKYLKTDDGSKRVAAAAIANSTIFFVITNFGVWASSTLYAKTFSGLVESYAMGLPFWRNMLLADMLFSVGIFALYRYAQQQTAVDRFDRKLGNIMGINNGGGN